MGLHRFIGALAEGGSTTCGVYSLCFPFCIVGKDCHAIVLNCRNTFKTCNGITSEFGAHFILLKEKYHKTILDGVKASGFPPLPVDYGYRRQQELLDC